MRNFPRRQSVIFIRFLACFHNLKNVKNISIKDNESWLELRETCSCWRDILQALVCQLAASFLLLHSVLFFPFICPNKDPEPISIVSYPFLMSPHWPRSVPNSFLLIPQVLLIQVPGQHNFISLWPLEGSFSNYLQYRTSFFTD